MCCALTRPARVLLIYRRDAYDLLRARRYKGGLGLEPDVLPSASPSAGIPSRLLGLHGRLGAAMIEPDVTDIVADVGGIGGTLAGNALSLAAMRATLTRY